MGIRVPKSGVLEGEICPQCPKMLYWPDGPDAAPLYVYLFFQGLSACADYNLGFLNNHYFRLHQDFQYPCRWFFESDDWSIWFWQWHTSRLGYVMASSIFYERVAFEAEFMMCQREYAVFDNSCSCSNPYHMATGGNCMVFWLVRPLKFFKDLIADYSGNSFYEPRLCEDFCTVDKFCCRLDKSNIKIKYDPSVL